MPLVHFDSSNRFWDTGVRKIVKNTPTPNFGEILSRLRRQGRLSILSPGKYFKRFLTKVKTFLRLLAPVETYFKNRVFKISQKPLEISKECTQSNLYVFKFPIIYVLGTIWYLELFLGYRGAKIRKKNTPNFGVILFWLCRSGETLDSQSGQIF